MRCDCKEGMSFLQKQSCFFVYVIRASTCDYVFELVCIFILVIVSVSMRLCVCMCVLAVLSIPR